MVVACLAFSFALAGSAVAGTEAVTSTLDRKEMKQVKKVAKKQANKQITRRAPGLSVASSVNAQNAVNADSATLAGTALQTFRDDSVAAPATTPGQNWTLLSAIVPAGSYVLTGKATVDNNETTGPVEIRCFMRVGSEVLDRANLGLGIQPGDEDIGPFMVTSVHSSPTPFTVVLECTNQGNAAGDTAAQDRKIVAYPVADVVSTQAAGP